ncbi:MAG: hypothetical protein M1835_004690 [Candelina submexicana]|nr:MAG: hypothetical protein M1835_004690 [Candelina submexicana]
MIMLNSTRVGRRIGLLNSSSDGRGEHARDMVNSPPFYGRTNAIITPSHYYRTMMEEWDEASSRGTDLEFFGNHSRKAEYAGLIVERYAGR